MAATFASVENSCIIHHESVNNNNKLVSLRDFESWRSLSVAAQLRKYVPVMKVSETIAEGEYPKTLQYHATCRSLFTMKRDLEKLNKDVTTETQSVRKSCRISNTPSEKRECGKLESKCLFCRKNKYEKCSNTKERLHPSAESRARESIQLASKLHKDDRIMAMSSEDLIAKEAMYHKTCYRDYTKIIYENRNINDEDVCGVEDPMEIAFSDVKKYLYWLHEHPDIIENSVLTSILESRLSSIDGIDCRTITSAKRNLRRRIERHFPGIKFLSLFQKRVFVYPDTLTLGQIIPKYMEIKYEFESLQKSTEKDNLNFKTGMLIRNEIKEMKDEMPWPPQPQDLTVDKIRLPESLKSFLNTLLSGSFNESNSTRINRLKLSIGQDLVYAVSHGHVKTPKSILYPFTIKSLTNCTELIDINNKLGHGVCRSILEELATENAFKVIAEQQDESLVMPTGMKETSLTIAVHDNIDRLEETLSGFGTSHKVNGILIQHGCFNTDALVRQEPKRRRCRRSFLLTTQPKKIEYISGKRVGPKHLEFPDNEERMFLFADQELLSLIWILSRKSIPRTIPSWTGFNITIRENIPVLTSSVGYLDCIDSPATQITTVYTILERCITIKEILKLSSIVCVFDQAIYSKAVEIKWKKPEKFKDCIIMLGMFHTIMMYLGIIGKRFKDAGLRDILIQSEVLAEGSIDRALAGKMYNRSVRYCKLLYEVLNRMLIEKMETQWKDDTRKQVIIHTAQAKIAKYAECISQNGYEDLLEDADILSYNNLFIDYKLQLEKDGGDLCKFWLSFIDMVNLLFNTLYASRVGSWDLLLECLRDITSYAFAYDNYNYARYLSAFLGEMFSLEHSHPEIHQEFLKGGFSVQIGDRNTFGRVEADKVIETTINRDTKTPGGTTGFSTNQNAVNRWTINASYRAALHTCFHKMLKYRTKRHVHNDLNPGRIKRDEKDIQSLTYTMTENFIDPFSNNDLLCLSNGMLVAESVAQDLLTAKQKGDQAMQKFIKNRLSEQSEISLFDPLKKLKLGTFSTIAKSVKTSCKDKVITIKASRNLFGQIAIIMQKRNLDLKEVFKYPLGPFPWSLAGPNGDLKKTSKVALLHELEKHVDPVEEYPSHYVSIIDGMAMVQKSRTNGITFKQLAQQLLQSVLSISKAAERIDIVFDVYRDDSIKNAERIKRSRGDLIIKNIVPSCIIKQWNSFLSSASNKAELIRFVVKQWEDEDYFLSIESETFFVTVDDRCIELSKDGARDFDTLRCTQEEADTRMFLHLIHASQTFTNFVIHTPDTDVFIISLAVSEMVPASIFIKTGCKDKTRIIDINAIKSSIQDRYLEEEVTITDFVNALLSLHAFTGCDTVSSFTGQGKVKALKLMAKDSSHIQLFKCIGESWNISGEIMSQIEAFVCQMYGHTMNDVNLLRYKKYCSMRGSIECERLPPCRISLMQHTLRANYQSRIWKLCGESIPDVPSPSGHGWKFEDNNISILWMDCRPAPDEILELLSCNCGRKCVAGSCSCVDNGLKCTEACKLQTCDNYEHNDIGEVDDESDSDDDSDVE